VTDASRNSEFSKVWKLCLARRSQSPPYRETDDQLEHRNNLVEQLYIEMILLREKREGCLRIKSRTFSARLAITRRCRVRQIEGVCPITALDSAEHTSARLSTLSRCYNSVAQRADVVPIISAASVRTRYAHEIIPRRGIWSYRREVVSARLQLIRSARLK